MANKRNSTKKSWLIFSICLSVYVIAALVAMIFGLDFLWKYMAAYEDGRPSHGIESYIETVTPEYICEKSADLIAKIDHHVQSEESCRQVIMDAVSDKIRYVKILSETTDKKIVYQIYSGSAVIGRAEMTMVGEPEYGYAPWQVTSDSFDLSFLLAENVGVTVPSNFPVYVNGNLLTEDYIIDQGIRYSILEEVYDDYSLPTMVTYEAGPFLTDATLEVTDPDGNPIVIDEDTDMNSLLPACSESELQQLDQIINDYILDYVAFVSVSKSDTYGNYERLRAHMVTGGELEKRMRAAIDGLYWVSDRYAVVKDITTSHYMKMDDGKYLCDITYVVQTNTYSGPSESTNHIKMVFVETAYGLRAEYMRTC